MSEERLKRIEILLETCAKATVNNQAENKEIRQIVNELSQQTANNQAEIKEVRQQVSQLTLQMGSLSEMFIESVGIMKTMQSDIKTMQSDIKTMQSEIKGLQTENNRILDHLFGKNQNN